MMDVELNKAAILERGITRVSEEYEGKLVTTLKRAFQSVAVDESGSAGPGARARATRPPTGCRWGTSATDS